MDGTGTIGITATETPKTKRKQKPKARAHGEGSVYFEDASGTWVAALDLGIVNGKRKRKRLRFETQQDARRALTKLTTAADAGIGAGNDRMTVRAFLDKWLSDVVEGPMTRLRIGTRASYALHVKNHLVPGLGHHTLARLSPLHVQAFLSSKLTETVEEKGDDDVTRPVPRFAPRTVQYLHATLKVALGWATKRELVSRNVARLVDAVPVPKREARMLSTEEAGKLLAAVDGDRLRALFYVAIAMGLRRSEICGLRWAEHVDLDRAVLRVRVQLRRIPHRRDEKGAIVVRGGLVVQELKTDKSRRTLKIPASVVDELRAHQKAQKAERLKAGSLWKDTGYVFATPFGEPLDGDSLHKRWERALVAAGLPDMPFHATRHTAGSFLLSQGADLRTVMGVLGHSEIALTANTYTHVLEELHSDAANRADAALKAARDSARRS
jgi:integrase